MHSDAWYQDFLDAGFDDPREIEFPAPNKRVSRFNTDASGHYTWILTPSETMQELQLFPNFNEIEILQGTELTWGKLANGQLSSGAITITPPPWQDFTVPERGGTLQDFSTEGGNYLNDSRLSTAATLEEIVTGADPDNFDLFSSDWFIIKLRNDGQPPASLIETAELHAIGLKVFVPQS